MTEKQRQERIAGGYLWWDTDEYLAHQAKVKDLMYEFNMSRPSEVEKRQELIQQMFGKVGKGVWINQPITLAVGSTVTIGDGTYINSGLTLIDDYTITIGKGCLFGTGVTLCTTGHPIDPAERAKGGMYSFPISIGDGAWIGAGAIVLPGITIGKYAVIGAGSVVTKDIPDYTVAVGNPCQPIRKINEHDKKYYWRNRRFNEQPEDLTTSIENG
ncbi:MAG: sugar O-acetyltransferase [Oscillospiraceae bacterium]|nr:sugar O-acetyltransferase [Oscillospiraceae bacterium]